MNPILWNPMRRACLLVSALVVAGCSDQSVRVELRSLQSSEDVSYVCRTPAGDGRPLSECHASSLFFGERDLYALVTQTSTGEVAVINVPLDPDDPTSDEGVVDLDVSTPGYAFLRVGARPTDIVSTPGGVASFVTVAEPGAYGVFGLPTKCLSAPAPGEPPRDLTTWPVCRLPSAPGNIELLLDPEDSCGAAVAAAERSDCAADLASEIDSQFAETGARKLLVTLPDAGSLVVIDAQWLLNQPTGTFADCQIDAEYPLSTDLPLVLPEQQLPPDLSSLNECTRSLPSEPPPPAVFTSRPSGLAHDDGVLYVSDDGVPLVHVLDVKRPCGATELLPLVPRSFEAPKRIVTTTGLSLSPLTPSNKRFLYAIDRDGSLMVFDVSPSSTDRTPIVRPGAPFLPFETPDRIALDGAVKDVTFLVRDRPFVDQTGTGTLGQACEPSPEITVGPGTAYRPNADYSRGARPAELRGVFAAVVLSRGAVTLVDVEDFDAPCRRPISGNTSALEDFRGCAGDAFDEYRSVNGPTVTDEVSCRIVEPHRARSANLAITSSEIGIRAPSLRSFPQLQVPTSVAQSTLVQRPKLLGVGFPAPTEDEPSREAPAQVYVGTTLYTERESPEQALNAEIVVDPSRARQYSLVLPFNEPRAYSARQDVFLTYEGAITAARSSGVLTRDAEGSFVLDDVSANYCDRGVHDPKLMQQIGAERFGLEGAALTAFGARHADYVVIQSNFPDEDERDWEHLACTRDQCLAVFDEFENDARDTSLLTNRDFSIEKAEQGRLVLEPRSSDPAVRELAPCCFPTAIEYVVRASDQWVLNDGSVRHAVVARPETLECVLDCNPKKRFFNSRVFEIAASSCTAAAPGEPETCGIGDSDADDVCVVDGRAGGVRLDEPAARCIHDTPTARFAVYRGEAPSARGMTFRWETRGGFDPMSLNLALPGVPVLPQNVVGLRDLDWLTVVDAEALGLTLIDLNDLTVLTPTLN